MDFSVEMLHAMEKDMDSEIVKLMKSLNVSSISEINQKSLEKTLNKGPLATFLSSFVKLYEIVWKELEHLQASSCQAW